MPKSVDKYTMMICCPGDVERYIPDIKEAVETFNRHFGDDHGIWLQVKHWKTDVYPEFLTPSTQIQSIGAGQQIIDNQLIPECEIALVIFWTKLGGGTEHELTKFTVNANQVFLYFLTDAIPHNLLKASTPEKLEEFRKNQQNIGLTRDVTDKYDLAYRLNNDLQMYFTRLLATNSMALKQDQGQESRQASHITFDEHGQINITVNVSQQQTQTQTQSQTQDQQQSQMVEASMPPDTRRKADRSVSADNLALIDRLLEHFTGRKVPVEWTATPVVVIDPRLVELEIDQVQRSGHNRGQALRFHRAPNPAEVWTDWFAATNQHEFPRGASWRQPVGHWETQFSTLLEQIYESLAVKTAPQTPESSLAA